MHAHVSIESADCDGRYSQSYILGNTSRDEWDFKADTIGNALAFADETATVTFTEFGFTFTHPTDEGYAYSEFTWCNDDDENERGTFRDHSAEAAGY